MTNGQPQAMAALQRLAQALMGDDARPMVKITAQYEPDDEEVDDDSDTGLTEAARAYLVDTLVEGLDFTDIKIERDE